MNDVLVTTTVWSYSRLAAFEKCPYQWYRHYVLGENGDDLFFSSFGTLCHDIIAKVYLGKCRDPLSEFLIRYPTEVTKNISNLELTTKYLADAIAYFSNMPIIPGKVIATETRMNFKVDKYPFVGVVDLVLEDSYGQLGIVDHKSKGLKPRSNGHRKKSDEELDSYLRQLYLYAIPIRERFGKFPTFLCFNCYRTRTFIKEPFDFEKIGETKQWALNTISSIVSTTSYQPNLDWFSCRNLCELHDSCEYYEMIQQ